MKKILISGGGGYLGTFMTQEFLKKYKVTIYDEFYFPWILKNKKKASHVHAMVVPGSGLVKQQAEQEGLDKIFIKSGFEWREPGCSMCLAMNADKLKPEERCASTSNRNFEGRQGRGGRTHLVSPGMAAAAAIAGNLDDVRKYQN